MDTSAGQKRSVGILIGNVVWRLADAAFDASAPLVGLGAAAGGDQGYASAFERAVETVAIVGSQVVEIPYEVFAKGGVFLDNEFLKYGLATFGDVASSMARAPVRTLGALAVGYLVAKAIAKTSSHYRMRWVRP